MHSAEDGDAWTSNLSLTVLSSFLSSSQKAVFEGIPGLKTATPIVAKKDDKLNSAPNPYLGPQDVIRTMMAALKNNDPESNSGLKTVLDFTAPENPILQNTKYFERMMINSKYSVLLGHFDDFAIVETKNFKDQETGKPIAIVGMKVFAPYKTLLTVSYPRSFREHVERHITRNADL